MRYLLPAAALLLLAIVPVDAVAAGPRQGIQIVNNNYVNNNNYNVGRSGYRGGYGYYGYDPYCGYHSRRYENHSEAAARIRAYHSRNRTYFHPRSYYNGPPYYDPRGW